MSTEPEVRSVAAVDADLVVMIAGTTIPTDPTANVDRALLAATNRAMFEQYADALAARPGGPPLVIVQSNPVELGVATFAERLERHRVVGAGAWSDTMRFRGRSPTTSGSAAPPYAPP